MLLSQAYLSGHSSGQLFPQMKWLREIFHGEWMDGWMDGCLVTSYSAGYEQKGNFPLLLPVWGEA